MLVVRAGRDNPQLNQGIDAFVAEALAVTRRSRWSTTRRACTQELFAQTFAFLQAVLRP